MPRSRPALRRLATAKVAARRLSCRSLELGLTIVSQNVGTVGLHADYILESLVEASPHICFLQEARTRTLSCVLGDAVCVLWVWRFTWALAPT